ncbi:MAG: methylated-DNA--[protein]-cysteine S-methyltransferase [Gammaproteobacteria bacterium]|nr:methylated-DNA--[protein]-cysteine S-methyltransferase [Gammaproteobacteria bacterium]
MDTPTGQATTYRARTDWPNVLLQACRLIEAADPGTRLTRRLASLGVGHAELQRQFRRHLGTTPKGYAQALRLVRLARGACHEPSALAATLGAGFDSPARGYAVATPALGVAPGRLRSRLTIGWWLGLSELGWMLMAATPKGICWLAFGDDPQVLLSELATIFPHGEWCDDASRLRAWFEAVREHVLLPQAAFALPLDVRGTAFQARVWRALQRIPLGATRSYAAIARDIGQPTAARAVAAACAANRIAVLIPCHRVVTAEGALSGYRWGRERKAALLGREGARAVTQRASSRAGSRRL